MEIPPGAVTETITLIYSPVPTATVPSGLVFAGHAFELNAYRDGMHLYGFAFEKPLTITIHYSDDDLVNVINVIDENTLSLKNWTGGEWVDAACSPYARHPDENWKGALTYEAGW